MTDAKLPGERPDDVAALLRQRLAFLEGCARELAAQRDLLGERAANLAGETARLRAGDGKETA